jgi:hypothetical protein
VPPRLSAPLACACLRPCACVSTGTRVLCECVIHTCTRAAQAHTPTLIYTKTTRETRTLPAILTLQNTIPEKPQCTPTFSHALPPSKKYWRPKLRHEQRLGTGNASQGKDVPLRVILAEFSTVSALANAPGIITSIWERARESESERASEKGGGRERETEIASERESERDCDIANAIKSQHQRTVCRYVLPGCRCTTQ